jgi:hypothetical protein
VYSYLHLIFGRFFDINYPQDNYRIVNFEKPEYLNGGTLVLLKSHLNLVDGSHCPSDRFLRLHFDQYYLAVSACGDITVTEDYGEHEIELFMDVYDDEIDTTDPKWSISLAIGFETHIVT